MAMNYLLRKTQSTRHHLYFLYNNEKHHFLQTRPGSSALTSSHLTLWAIAPFLLLSCSYHNGGGETYC